MVLGNRLAFMGRPSSTTSTGSLAVGATEAGRARLISSPSQPFECIPKGFNAEVAFDHMLPQAGPAGLYEENLVQAPLVHGQVEGPPLPLPQGPLDEPDRALAWRSTT